jgi:Domain of unknown function (DUF4351)
LNESLSELEPRQLTCRVGNVAPEARSQVQALSLAQLEFLGEALLDFVEAGDWKQWLKTHSQNQPLTSYFAGPSCLLGSFFAFLSFLASSEADFVFLNSLLLFSIVRTVLRKGAKKLSIVIECRDNQTNLHQWIA